MPLLPKAKVGLLLLAVAGAARAFDIRDLYSGAVKGDVSPVRRDSWLVVVSERGG